MYQWLTALWCPAEPRIANPPGQVGWEELKELEPGLVSEGIVTTIPSQPPEEGDEPGSEGRR